LHIAEADIALPREILKLVYVNWSLQEVMWVIFLTSLRCSWCFCKDLHGV